MNPSVRESQRDSVTQPRVGPTTEGLPWVSRIFIFPQPQRGCIKSGPPRRNPVGVEDHFGSFTQGSRFTPTLGWMTLPRWGNGAATADAAKATLRNAVTATDQQIDQLVYELYGLSPEEIALVEVRA